MIYVNNYHLGGISIDNEPCDESYCETCGDSNTAFEFSSLEEACLYVYSEFGEETLRDCGYEIKVEVKEVE